MSRNMEFRPIKQSNQYSRCHGIDKLEESLEPCFYDGPADVFTVSRLHDTSNRRLCNAVEVGKIVNAKD